jgi:hypothetical protein
VFGNSSVRFAQLSNTMHLMHGVALVSKFTFAELFGSIWEHLGTSGSICAHLEPSEIQNQRKYRAQSHMEFRITGNTMLRTT